MGDGVLVLSMTLGRELSEEQESQARYPVTVLGEAAAYSPILQAFHKQEPIFHGDPVFGKDWPFAAFPVLRGGRPIGVLYADRSSATQQDALEPSEQVAVTALAEEARAVPSVL